MCYKSFERVFDVDYIAPLCIRVSVRPSARVLINLIRYEIFTYPGNYIYYTKEDKKFYRSIV